MTELHVTHFKQIMAVYTYIQIGPKSILIDHNWKCNNISNRKATVSYYSLHQNTVIVTTSICSFWDTHIWLHIITYSQSQCVCNVQVYRQHQCQAQESQAKMCMYKTSKTETTQDMLFLYKVHLQSLDSVQHLSAPSAYSPSAVFISSPSLLMAGQSSASIMAASNLRMDS